ncbi:hypothetical protein ILT44_26950 [Microvirga sp. BT689]|uniref:hypothetical protein n=1 Tax=Microvirga arvi TaxID=2778731 RepID=UPI001950A92D|nr:hypothetical protein [Microvirga arvi]MBM6583843.1 hypothetical protein [Microvirga arvi]
MPNWVHTRVHLSGASEHIAAFRKACIRPITDEDGQPIGFDFGSLLPMPAAAKATLQDRSEEARQQAIQATGYESWYDWRCDNWGVKWNSSAFRQIALTPSTFEFGFTTPWALPTPIFEALSKAFPLLSGRVVATEWGEEWVAIASFADGKFNVVSDALTREIAFIAAHRSWNPSIGEAIGATISEFIGKDTVGRDHCPPGNGLWERLARHLPPDMVRRLEFTFDAERFIEWHDVASSQFPAEFEDDDSDDLRPLEDIVRSQEVRTFLNSNGRTFSKIDRQVIESLCYHIQGTIGSSMIDMEIERDSRQSAERIFDQVHPNECWEWAAHAFYRTGVHLNLAELSTLKASFVSYTLQLRRDVLAFLRQAQEADSLAA